MSQGGLEAPGRAGSGPDGAGGGPASPARAAAPASLSSHRLAPHQRTALDQPFSLRSKTVCPGRWDVSAAEHVTAGETYSAAAVRGLAEELGIAVEGGAALAGPLGPARRSVFQGDGVLDRELVQTFRRGPFFLLFLPFFASSCYRIFHGVGAGGPLPGQPSPPKAPSRPPSATNK